MDTVPNGKVIEILLVEDNPGDARLTQEAFRDSKVANNLHVVSDGALAMEFLRRQGPYAKAPRPDIVLLDLNLPKMDGRQVLAAMKSDPALKSIPTVVLTTSEAEQDIAQSYQLHANCYLTKPVDLEKFLKIIRCIEDFWLSFVKLPSKFAA
jgi:CheY-like chemotaxis protein